MDSLIFIIPATFAIMTASLAGAATLLPQIKLFLEHRLAFLVSFSAGVLLFSALFMINEAHELVPSLFLLLTLILAGYFLAHLFSWAIPHFHHHHDQSCSHKHTRSGRILVADGIHNIADGLVLVPAFIVSPLVGLGITFSIFVHELLQGLSQFFVLRQSGLSTTKSLLLNFATSTTIVIGVLIGLAMSSSYLLQGALLAISAGFFISLVLHDLLPKHRELSFRESAIHIAMIITGVLLITLVNSLATHGHDEEVHKEHAEEHGAEAHSLKTLVQASHSQR